MKHILFSKAKSKHAQLCSPLLFISLDGHTRIAAAARGGWRCPTALDLALASHPARRAGTWREED
jgi:hypothetical protein